MTRALKRTCLTTQQLVIMLRTQRPVITDVLHMHTDFGRTTAVETRTGVHVTAVLVLMAGTVVDTIAANKDRQAEISVWAPEMGLRTQ